MPPRRRIPTPSTQEKSVNVNADQSGPMQQFVNLLVGALMNPQAAPTATFKDFKAVGPPEFKGATDPIEAQTWITEIEKVFEVAKVAEDQKTAFATFMMKGEANYWWGANKSRAGGGVVPWERFKELFFETYFPQSIQDSMEAKFLELKQGKMTVTEYAAKFNELARFAPHQVDIEARKARRFEQGLKPWLYSKVSLFQIRTFAGVLEKAIIAEESSEALTKYNQDRRGKKNDGGSKERNSSERNTPKRKWNGRPGNAGDRQGDSKKRVDACSNCGRNHQRVRLKGKNVCYRCG